MARRTHLSDRAFGPRRISCWFVEALTQLRLPLGQLLINALAGETECWYAKCPVTRLTRSSPSLGRDRHLSRLARLLHPTRDSWSVRKFPMDYAAHMESNSPWRAVEHEAASAISELLALRSPQSRSPWSPLVHKPCRLLSPCPRQRAEASGSAHSMGWYPRSASKSFHHPRG